MSASTPGTRDASPAAEPEPLPGAGRRRRRPREGARTRPRPLRPHGPSAFGSDLRRFWALTLTLARTEFKLRFFGSVLGYLWSLMRPLMLFGVLYFVFVVIARVGTFPYFGVYLLASIVLFTYFAEVTGASVTCLVAREAMLRKVRFPRMVIPLAVSLTALFNLGMNLIAVLVFALLSGVRPRWSWVEMPVLVVGLVIFATGIGMLLSALYVRYRDVQPIWEVISQALFYASPVLYAIDTARSQKVAGMNAEHLLMNNPLAVVFTQMRYAVLPPFPRAQSAAQAIGGWPHLAVPLGIVAGVFAFGLWFFNREAPRIAENL
ncbi:MAG: type transport system permease protein [Solirubrobacteraceae bacterium]|jgi:ABC-2 type transport system permease protein|nr:type transport system permease protein [Solirubrobacteraceae bacterium]